jgi:hypothetical protein
LNDAIANELFRLQASDLRMHVESAAGVPGLVTVTFGSKSWSVTAPQFLEVVAALPDGAGPIAIRRALRRYAVGREAGATR